VIQEQIVPALEQCVHAPLGQNQHAALIDLAWNVGTPAVCGSTLVRKFNAGDCRGAGAEFLRWVWAGGKRWPGLVSRRRVEARAFLQDCV
jgi:lysozyme